MKKIVTVDSSYKTLNNSGNGIDYELYKIIKENIPEEIIMRSYRNIILSKEGVEYWLAYYANKIEVDHD